MSRPVIAYHLFDFAPVLSGWNKISVSAGPSGDLVMLVLKQWPSYRSSDGLSSKSFVDKPNNYRVYHLKESGWAICDLQETHQNMRYVQPLLGNQWAVVRTRSAGNTDGNGHICSAQGDLLRTVAFGDGIQDIQTTASGQIWVSYFDQGIYGDTTFGHTGLACFGSDDRLLFDFNRLTQGMIADCYAFNAVSNDEVWLCPYTDFPIVKLKDGKINHAWDNNPIHGSHAFAVWKDRALFSGGYGEHDKLFIVSLYRLDGKELMMEECHAVDENGGEIKFKSAFSRGSRLYLETDQSLYSVELQET